MAGLLAAIMSSIDSTLNSAAALMTMDFLRPQQRGWSATRIAWVGRGFIVLFMLLAAMLSPMIENFSGLFHYLQSALAYLVPPVAVVFIVGLFWRRTTATAAFATLLGGHAVSALLFIGAQQQLLTLHFTIIAGLLTLVSVLICVLVSMVTVPAQQQQVSRYSFDAATMARQPGLAWWQDYRLYSVILVLLATALVITHW